MGFDALRWAYRQQTSSGYGTAILRYLADQVRQLDPETKQTNPDWTITTTREAIAEGVEFSVSTVRRGLLHLKDEGFIEWQDLGDGNYVVRLRPIKRAVPPERERVPIDQDLVPTEQQRVPIEQLYKEDSREESQDQENTPREPVGPPADPAFQCFVHEFESRHNCTPYRHKRGDFVQLAQLRNHLGIRPRDSLPDWSQAVANYFATPQGQYSLADLCSRYPTFRLHALDRFKQPITGDANATYHRHGPYDNRQTGRFSPGPRPYRPRQ